MKEESDDRSRGASKVNERYDFLTPDKEELAKKIMLAIHVSANLLFNIE